MIAVSHGALLSRVEIRDEIGRENRVQKAGIRIVNIIIFTDALKTVLDKRVKKFKIRIPTILNFSIS